jgi:hypothetical protein
LTDPCSSARTTKLLGEIHEPLAIHLADRATFFRQLLGLGNRDPTRWRTVSMTVLRTAMLAKCCGKRDGSVDQLRTRFDDGVANAKLAQRAGTEPRIPGELCDSGGFINGTTDSLLYNDLRVQAIGTACTLKQRKTPKKGRRQTTARTSVCNRGERPVPAIPTTRRHALCPENRHGSNADGVPHGPRTPGDTRIDSG